MRGWAIPTATDIAFALGILSLLGRRVPLSIKLFLMALAIFDDIGAIAIIAFFYQAKLGWGALLGALLCWVVLIGFNRFRVYFLWPYLLLGAVLWIFLLNSGIHPTLAGVLVAFTVPLYQNQAAGRHQKQRVSTLHIFESCLDRWVAYGVLPVFSFANAGVAFVGHDVHDLLTPLSIAIMAGLLIGKQLGVLGTTYLAIKMRWVAMPRGATWRDVYGMALICGVGFTMSLFIGGLAFVDLQSQEQMLVRLGVFGGSFVSGLLGYLILRTDRKGERPLALASDQHRTIF